MVSYLKCIDPCGRSQLGWARCFSRPFSLNSTPLVRSLVVALFGLLSAVSSVHELPGKGSPSSTVPCESWSSARCSRTVTTALVYRYTRPASVLVRARQSALRVLKASAPRTCSRISQHPGGSRVHRRNRRRAEVSAPGQLYNPPLQKR